MKSPQPVRKTIISAILNLVAGFLFIIAAFHIITGESGVDWMWLIVGILFIAGGIWGIIGSQK
jgi:hypothetical protein